jgi:membrane dipeptidase
MGKLAKARSLIAANPEFALVEKIQDIDAARAAGKLAVGLHLEGTNCMERQLEMVRLFYDLGIRQCIPAFNLNNAVAGGCADLQDPGLSRLGVRFIDEMQAVGMVVDLSHTGYRSSMQALERATKPMVFSHSNADSIAPHYRNIRDDQIKACASTGGVIGVSGASIYLGDARASADSILQHIEHIFQTAGPQHVGLGTDYVADTEDLARYVQKNADEWPDKLGLPENMPVYSQPEQLIELTELMLRRGYTDHEVRGVLGENFRRVCAANWQ